MKNRKSSFDLHRKMKVRVPKDYPWRVLGALTEDLRDSLADNDYALVKTIIRNRDHQAYRSLSETLVPQSMVQEGTSVHAMAAMYQVASLLKKYRFPSSSQMRKEAALKKFIAAEAACESFNTEGWKRIIFSSDPLTISIFTHVRNFLTRLLGSTLPEESKLRHWSRHGPGANLDTTNRNTSAYFKYSEWPYSCTDAAFPYAVRAISSDERWLGALEDSYRERFNVPKYAILNQDVFWSNVLKEVDGNRVAFVPKNSQTDRSIAIEPAMNLYLQLGVDGYIRRRLLRWGVNLDDQTKNQVLAREGSSNWRDPECFVTLDLSAASDSVSTELCKQILPPHWYTYLMDLRSPKGKYGCEEFSYQKISSMGNGYTFALESAIFTAIVYGVMKAVRGQFRKDMFAVYGDDIIVPKNLSSYVIDTLNLCGFSVNEEKTFLHGPFRESCGADWFNGHPVRPVFLSEAPSTVCGIWCDLNRLRRILTLRWNAWESNTSTLIRSWIPECFRYMQGPLSDDDFDSYEHTLRPTGRYRRFVWTYKRLVLHAKPQRGGHHFHFRKLMSSLRGGVAVLSPWSSKTWGGARLQNGGSVFDITSPSAVIPSVSPTETSIWSQEYNE